MLREVEVVRGQQAVTGLPEHREGARLYEGVPELEGRPGLDARGDREGASVLHSPAGVIRGAELADRAVGDESAEGGDSLGELDAAVLGVGPEQVHGIKAEALEARGDPVGDRLRRQSLGARRPRIRHERILAYLRRDLH